MTRAVDLVAELSADGHLEQSDNLELTLLAIRLDEVAARVEKTMDRISFDLHGLRRAHEAALSSFFTRLAGVVARRPEAEARHWLTQRGIRPVGN